MGAEPGDRVTGADSLPLRILCNHPVIGRRLTVSHARGHGRGDGRGREIDDRDRPAMEDRATVVAAVVALEGETLRMF